MPRKKRTPPERKWLEGKRARIAGDIEHLEHTNVERRWG